MDGYWIWCGSPIKACEDGRYYLFASRWPRTLTFSGHWITNSEVILASSATPEGPYAFEKVVLPWRHRRYFDALSTHNPCVVHFDGVYYLYYTGITYDFDIPTPERQIHESTYPEHQELYRAAWQNKRIGLATSQTVHGPWQRQDRPLIEPRPDQWDALITSNAAVAVRDDGFTVLIYKSRRDWSAPFQLGVATAPHPSCPYARASDDPIFAGNCEDPCIWWSGGRFHMVMKDFSGALCGEPEAGGYAWSEDGVRWTVEPGFRSYSRTILWDDGTSVEHGNAERPGVLLGENGPTHLFLATSDGPRRHWQSEETRTVCIPLEQQEAGRRG
jgi:hypothetical protein